MESFLIPQSVGLPQSIIQAVFTRFYHLFAHKAYRSCTGWRNFPNLDTHCILMFGLFRLRQLKRHITIRILAIGTSIGHSLTALGAFTAATMLTPTPACILGSFCWARRPGR